MQEDEPLVPLSRNLGSPECVAAFEGGISMHVSRARLREDGLYQQRSLPRMSSSTLRTSSSFSIALVPPF